MPFNSSVIVPKKASSLIQIGTLPAAIASITVKPCVSVVDAVANISAQ